MRLAIIKAGAEWKANHAINAMKGDAYKRIVNTKIPPWSGKKKTDSIRRK